MSDAPAVYRREDGTVVFRASAADRCTKELVAMLMDETKIPMDADRHANILRAWAQGHEYEPVILDHIRRREWRVYGEQKEVSIRVYPNILIVGHIDALARKVGVSGSSRVLECKALNEDSYKKWCRHSWEAYPGYAVQISLYMEALQRRALYAVMRKPNEKDPEPEFSVRELNEPPVMLTPTFDRLREIVRLADLGELPVTCDRNQFPCAYPHLHEDTDENLAAQLDKIREKRRGALDALKEM